MFRHVFAIDPGEVNNGFCYFKYNTETKRADTKIMKVYTVEDLNNMLKVAWGLSQGETETDITFVVENFRVNSNDDPRKKTWFWDEVKTVRVIGGIELAAKWCGAKIVLQEPSNVLPMARKWAPFKMAKHPKDDQSAWCHGVHYMMNMKWIGTPDQVSMFGQEAL